MARKRGLEPRSSTVTGWRPTLNDLRIFSAYVTVARLQLALLVPVEPLA